MAKFEFYKSTIVADSVILLSNPTEGRKGLGAETFMNKLTGDYNGYTDKWIGFRKQPLEVIYEFKEPVLLSSVGMHIMVDGYSGIFPPASLEVWGGTEKTSMKLLGQLIPPQPGKKDKESLVLIQKPISPSTVQYLKIVAKPLAKIPALYKLKDHPLLLVDEILLN